MTSAPSAARAPREGRSRYVPRRKVCVFCAEHNENIDYKVADRLQRFLSDRGRIEPRRKTGTCARHQRRVALAIKRARHLALMPYTQVHLRVSGMITPRQVAAAVAPAPVEALEPEAVAAAPAETQVVASEAVAVAAAPAETQEPAVVAVETAAPAPAPARKRPKAAPAETQEPAVVAVEAAAPVRKRPKAAPAETQESAVVAVEAAAAAPVRKRPRAAPIKAAATAPEITQAAPEAAKAEPVPEAAAP